MNRVRTVGGPRPPSRGPKPPRPCASQGVAPEAAGGGEPARRLLAWYARSRRDLPWRRSRDPYGVWVSEIMLQQTQVERVKEFFARFMDRFPTVAALAAAPDEEVMRLWEGLGYYRRARQLVAAARRIVDDHGGRFPRTAAGLRALPGIGRYTAAAIASIAFDRPEPIVEANSRRVLARLVAHAAPPTGPRGDEPLWEVAAALVPRKRAGLFNQALMDLGALVCTPTRPACDRCPLAELCEAHRLGRTASIPARAPRRETVTRRETAVVVRRGGRVLVVRRGPDEWWTGLWDFPRVAGPSARVARGLASGPLAVLRCGPPESVGRLTHGVTHHRIVLDVVTCAASGSRPRGPGWKWVTPAALRDLALTAPGRRIAADLVANPAKTN